MSSISSVSTSSSLYQNSNVNSLKQAFQNLQAIGGALQSGDLSGAQGALTAFQQALTSSGNSNSQSSSTQPFGKNSQANTDYQNLVSALQSGNLSNAQQAYSNLQKDLKAGHKGHHHHHHVSSTPAGSTTTTGGTTNSSTSSTPTGTTGGNGSLLNASA